MATSSFGSAFAAARKAGKKTFTWNGKKYTTAVMATSSFGSAFAAARKAGKKTFTWNGKKYTTELRKELPKTGPKPTAKPKPKAKDEASGKKDFWRIPSRKEVMGALAIDAGLGGKPRAKAKEAEKPKAKPKAETKTAKANVPTPTPKPKRKPKVDAAGLADPATMHSRFARAETHPEKKIPVPAKSPPRVNGKAVKAIPVPSKSPDASARANPANMQARFMDKKAPAKRKRKDKKRRGILSILGIGGGGGW